MPDDHDGQRTSVPDEQDAIPTGRPATPPSRDPDHPDAPGPGAAERTDLNPAETSEPEPPEGVAWG